MNRMYFFIFLVVLYFLLDFYVFSIVRDLTEDYSSNTRKAVMAGYWLVTVLVIGGLVGYNYLDPETFRGLRILITTFFFVTLVSKLFAALVILGEDIRRGVTYAAQFFSSEDTRHDPGRSDFMAKSALIAGAIPLTTLSFGIISGAHDYRVRQRVITSPNLPSQFDGIRVAQISDIHTGSFFNKTAVQGGVDLLNAEKPDLVCFTGDLVNNRSDEAKPYLDIFKQIEAPLGVYSTMGNHDYGDYASWKSKEAKQQDIKNLHDMHRYMGWHIMLNENKIIRVDGGELALLGIENWGAGGFSKYGDMEKTTTGVEHLPFKILMSHDPSHWDAQVTRDYKDVDLTLAGHTHGMQFGIEFGNFRWSPVKYLYKQWADLYEKEGQYLYVNRGYGFIGYPGRIGILPEITILELRRG